MRACHISVRCTVMLHVGIVKNIVRGKSIYTFLELMLLLLVAEDSIKLRCLDGTS